MPFYEFDLEVPAATAADSPATSRARLHSGRVTGVSITFPAGCAGLVSADIHQEEHRVWPANPEHAFSGDDVVIRWDEDYELERDPFIFELRAWSPDARFKHTLRFRFEVTRTPRSDVAGETLSVLRQIGQFLGLRR